MKRILVLCTGNACRSQMAEAYLNFFATEEVEVFSAGLQPRGVHPLAIAIMKDDYIDISQARSKDVAEFSTEAFDYLITVCDNANDFKPADISATAHFHYSIPDPDEDQFDTREPFQVFYETRELVKKEMLRFIGKHLNKTEREETLI